MSTRRGAMASNIPKTYWAIASRPACSDRHGPTCEDIHLRTKATTQTERGFPTCGTAKVCLVLRSGTQNGIPSHAATSISGTNAPVPTVCLVFERVLLLQGNAFVEDLSGADSVVPRPVTCGATVSKAAHRLRESHESSGLFAHAQAACVPSKQCRSRPRRSRRPLLAGGARALKQSGALIAQEQSVCGAGAMSLGCPPLPRGPGAHASVAREPRVCRDSLAPVLAGMSLQQGSHESADAHRLPQRAGDAPLSRTGREPLLRQHGSPRVSRDTPLPAHGGRR